MGIGKPGTNLIRKHVEVNLGWTSGPRRFFDGLARQDQLGELFDPTIQVLHGVALVHLLSNDRKRDEKVRGTKQKLESPRERITSWT